MSEKRESQVVSGGGDTSGLHSPSFFRNFGRRAGILAAAAIVLIAGSVGLRYLRSPGDTGAQPSKSAQRITDDAVYKSVQNPDYAAATKQLRAQLKATSDNKKKADIYVALTSIALQQGKYQEVVDNELQAIKANPAREGEQSSTLADAYNKLGNKTEALKYYQKALAYYQSKPENFSGREYFMQMTQAKITELSK